MLARLLRRRVTEDAGHVKLVFAGEILSAVTEAECHELARRAVGRRVLELGSYLGRSTIALAANAEVVHSVDPHNGGPPGEENTLSGFLENIGRYGVRDRVIVHVGTSTEVVPAFREGLFDLAFIDAVHQRPHVDVDAAMCARCLAPGGALAFHDYNTDGAWADGKWHPFGVRDAVDELVELSGADVHVVDSLAVVVSPAADAPEAAKRRWRAAIDALPSQNG